MNSIVELLGYDPFEDGTSKAQWIDNMIHSACLAPDEKVFCESLNCDDIDPELEDMLIKYLLDAQPDRIRNAQNYSQRDIQNLLKQL